MSIKRDWNAYNRDVITEFRANGGKQRMLLLTTTGARSGQAHTTPLNYSTDGDRFVVIGSKGGSPTHPDWYHNLIKHPEATVELGREQFAVRATVADGAERERLFDQQATEMPFFARYRETTPRQIPVIILERTG